MGDPHQKYNIDLIPVGCSNICVWGDLCVCCMIGVLLLLSAYNGIWSIPKVSSTSPNDQVDYKIEKQLLKTYVTLGEHRTTKTFQKSNAPILLNFRSIK